MDIKQLMEELKKQTAKIDVCKGMVDDAESKGVEEEIKTATKALDTALAEQTQIADKLEKAIEDDKRQNRVKSILDSGGSLIKAIPPQGASLSGNDDGNGNGGDGDGDQLGKRQKALDLEFRTMREKELEQCDLFVKFFQTDGKGMSDNELDALQPKSKTLREEAGTVCAVIPKSMMAKMLNPYAKALPMLSTDDDLAGGRANLLYPEYGTQINQLPSEEPSLFMRVTKKFVTGGKLVEPRLKQDDANEFGGVIVTRSDEGADATDTEMEMERVEFECFPMHAYTTLTRELQKRDRYGIESELTDKFGKALRAAFDSEIMHGTGTKQCLGIRNASPRTTNRQTLNQIEYQDLVNMLHAIQPYHRPGATWMLDDTVLQALRGITDTLGRPVFSQSVGSGPTDRLLNYPWFVSTRLSTLGTPGDCVFGNLLHYWFCIEEEIVISKSEHAEFKKGLIAYRLDALTGGKPMFDRAFDVLIAPA